jgi:hypothetical protein
MSKLKQGFALTILRTSLSLVVMVQAVLFLVYSSLSGAHVVPVPARIVLGGGEIGGALLFLVPPTLVIGGWLLIVIFAFALLIHLAHGQFEGALVIYIAAVFTVLSQRHSLRKTAT